MSQATWRLSPPERLSSPGIALRAGEAKAVIKTTGFSARVELMKGSQQMITSN